jgi:hypothetical protein
MECLKNFLPTKYLPKYCFKNKRDTLHKVEYPYTKFKSLEFMSVVYKHAILTKIISMLHIIINSNILQCQTFEIGLLKSIVQDNIRLTFMIFFTISRFKILTINIFYGCIKTRDIIFKIITINKMI